MALPEIDIAQVQRSCAARVPEHARHQVRVEREVTPRHLTIVERRVPWREDLGPDWTSLPIARLHYTAVDQSWTLYWRDRNHRYHLYDQCCGACKRRSADARPTAPAGGRVEPGPLVTERFGSFPAPLSSLIVLHRLEPPRQRNRGDRTPATGRSRHQPGTH
ncbi:MAG TPA: DUF3024 domain-containing protein [Mycobacterium sp.]